MIIFTDFETRSDVDISRGSYAYAEAPTTSAMCGHFRREDGLECFWTPEQYVGWEPPPGIQYAWGMQWIYALFADPTNTFIAHNAEFDQAIAELCLKLPPARWIDSMALADYLGFPGGLDAIAQHLWGVGKDKAGYALMMKLCKPYRGAWVPITHEHLTQLCIYNMRDAELMARFWNEYSAALPGRELPVFISHQAVNRRGVPFDCEWAQALLNMNQLIGGMAAQAAEQATGGLIKITDLSRVAFLKKWINQVGALYGWSVDSVDEETVTPMLQATDDIVPPYLKLVLEARLATSRASIKKMASALNAVSADGRLRGQMRIYGAHTHRWTGRGVQIHNLPRPHPAFSGDNPEVYKSGEANPYHAKSLIERARDACVRLDPTAFLSVVQDAGIAARRISPDMTISTNDVLTSLIRPMFHAAPGKVIVGADYSQIEGRGAAWIANDTDELNAYRANDAGKGPDLYCVMASKIFGRPITKNDTNERQAGKVAVLGAGYGMSSDRFDETNAPVLKRAGVERGVIIPLWRQTHPRICYTWRACEKAYRRTVLGQRPEHLDGGFVFDSAPGSPWLTLTLPSGRQMFYHGARLERVDDDPRCDDTQLVYDNHRKGDGETKAGLVKTYGAKIFENVVQSFCRDFLADVIVDAEAAGLPVIMHTHDEINTEVDAAAAKDAAAWLKQRMAQAPAWAPDIPLKGAPSVMHRYGK